MTILKDKFTYIKRFKFSNLLQIKLFLFISHSLIHFRSNLEQQKINNKANKTEKFSESIKNFSLRSVF